ncbi:ABC transporter permease [Ekhidna sp.]|uniref:ABC transporter permease n=1 Tax=Ekhidna sp. TaxID=2608089 RepID=UPI003B505000
MFRNFLKITFRNFQKNKSYVLINLIGLGLSLACCIVGYLNWKYDATFDHNHLNHDKIYKIHSYKSVQGEQIKYGITPIGLGEQIKEKIPGITKYSRYESMWLIFKKEDKVLKQHIGYAEDDYFEMFSFPFKYGSKEAFKDKSNVILTEKMAEIYFGEGDPTGKMITLIDLGDKEVSMRVGGVLKDIPRNSSMTFSAITHYDNYLKLRDFKNDSWEYFNAATFVMTEGQFPQNLLDYVNQNCIEVQNKARDNFQLAGYYLEPLTTLARNSDKIRSNWLNEAPPSSAIIGPGIMAIMILLIACFNFTNTSIAISSKRLKEIGLRKVMGSQRRQLIFQFMGENIILCFAALLVGLAIADILVPTYSSLWRFIDIELNLASDPEIYLFLAGLLLATALIAGAYPSLYISKYQPVKILRGNLRIGGSSRLSRGLLGMQYLLTTMSLVSAYAFYNNAEFQSNYDLGFNKEPLLSIGFDSHAEYKNFRPVVEQVSGIEKLAATYNRIGDWSYTRTLKSGQAELETEMMDFTTEYFDLMNLEIIEGRFFDDNMREHDRINSIVVNEQLVKEFGWTDPVGQVVQIDDTTRLSVIGVVNDFYDEGFFNDIEPTGIRMADPNKLYYLMVKSNKNPVELYDQLQAEWFKVAPNKPFNAEYDSEVESANEVNTNIMLIFEFMAFISLVLSLIGLYTLVSLNIIKRIKEIGVRKVLGASIRNIIVMMNQQFFWLLMIASAMGALGAYFSLDLLMGSIFDIYQPGTLITYFLPFFILVLVAVIFASARIFATAIKNPVESLRYE